ncbi:MAG: hypothetical protein M1834_009760 [Cirrosporium novae-zelandiae]|nr:MAG: hypothetical protein M1834_009760 [Cirrosporium novae-zelandiae]
MFPQPMNSAPYRMTVCDLDPNMSCFSDISVPTSLAFYPTPYSETDFFVNTAMTEYQSTKEPMILFQPPNIIDRVSQPPEAKDTAVYISQCSPVKHENYYPVYSVPFQWGTCQVPSNDGTSISSEAQFNTEIDTKPRRSNPQQTITAPQTDTPLNLSVRDTQASALFTLPQHDGGRKHYFASSSCDRSFSRITHPNNHIQEHTGEKLYVY